MSRVAIQIRRGLTFLHRWLGVAFCVLFAVWYLSGFVMMYWTFPRIDSSTRLARADVLAASRILLSPQQAFAHANLQQIPDRVLMNMVDGRPVYRFFIETHQYIVFADNGALLGDVPEDMARRIAASWIRQPLNAARFEGAISEPDQWTVNGAFRAYGSLLRYSWPDGQELYVSPVTAEVVQYTTRNSRIAAYFGAIPHWLYFTPLRRNTQLWTRVVIWSSGLATIAALSGLVIGLWRYSPFKGYRTRNGLASFPYTGQQRWHAILGLVFGLFVCTWAFSGMMSMDPFPADTRSRDSSQRLTEALRGTSVRLSAFEERDPREALAYATGLNTKELEFLSFSAEPFYLVTEAPGITRIVPIRSVAQREIKQQRLMDVLTRASLPYKVEEARAVNDYEAYYVERRTALPLPVLFMRLNDPAESMFYIDPRTARIVKSFNASSRWTRWIYHGLHSIDLPWLYRNRPAWDLVVLILLSGGSALCFTSLVIGWRVLRTLL